MTQFINSILDVSQRFEAIVLDQWGVLHNGTLPYPKAVQTLKALKANGTRLAVLSNSGKRAAPNLKRITEMGFSADLFELVMTSGEALWLDTQQQVLPHTRFYAVERNQGDAAHWAKGLQIRLCEQIKDAEAVLLMGLPDGFTETEIRELAAKAKACQLPIYCSNPDRASPRADGILVLSPGEVAHQYQDQGGTVQYYGKPHAPIFDAVQRSLNLPADKILMVGDSLEHDIKGGHQAGWSTLFIQGGLHAESFASGTLEPNLQALALKDQAPLPTFSSALLQ